MSAAVPAFSARHYSLASCTLSRLEDVTQARELAEMLAGLEPWRTLGYSADGLARYFLRDDPGLRRCRIAEGTRTQGVVCIRYPWLRGPYIELIGLAPYGQGQGLGGQILAWIEEQARGEAANLWAVVSSFNEPARRFYARHGFFEIAPLDDLVAAGSAEILLRKRF